jgi:hypothetical protein
MWISDRVVWLMEPRLAPRASANSPADNPRGSEIINTPNTRPNIRERPNCPNRSPKSSTYLFRSSSNVPPYNPPPTPTYSCFSNVSINIETFEFEGGSRTFPTCEPF